MCTVADRRTLMEWLEKWFHRSRTLAVVAKSFPLTVCYEMKDSFFGIFKICDIDFYRIDNRDCLAFIILIRTRTKAMCIGHLS